MRGAVHGHWYMGSLLYSCVLVTVTLKASLTIRYSSHRVIHFVTISYWTKYTVIAVVGSLALWFLFLPFYEAVSPLFQISEELQGVSRPLFLSATFWLTIIICPAACLIRDFAWK